MRHLKEAHRHQKQQAEREQQGQPEKGVIHILRNFYRELRSLKPD
jgi:hypothetical protein